MRVYGGCLEPCLKTNGKQSLLELGLQCEMLKWFRVLKNTCLFLVATIWEP